MHRWIFLLLALILVVGCGTTSAEHATAPEQSFAQSRERFAESGERLVVRTASIEVTVDNPEERAAEVTALVEGLGGYISNSTTNEKSARLLVRVPSSELSGFLDSVSELGEEENRTVTGKDVTDSYSDLEAEIENLESMRDRLRDLLDRANDVEEVLKVERELTRVQTTLDSKLARKQRMATDIQLSAVTVSLPRVPEKRILGPLGLLYEGTKWLVVKLFVISH